MTELTTPTNHNITMYEIEKYDISAEEIESIMQDLMSCKGGEHTDVIQLQNNYCVDNRRDAKRVLREMIREDLIIPHPGSKYKIRKGVEYQRTK